MAESKPPFEGRDFAREEREVIRKALEQHLSSEQLAEWVAMERLAEQPRTTRRFAIADTQLDHLVPRGHVFPGIPNAGELINAADAAGTYFRILSGGQSLMHWCSRMINYRHTLAGWVDAGGQPADDPIKTMLLLAWVALEWLRDAGIRHYRRAAGTTATPEPWIDFDLLPIDGFEEQRFDSALPRTRALTLAGLWNLLSIERPIIRHDGQALEAFATRSDVVLAAPEMLSRAVNLHGDQVLGRLGLVVKPAATGVLEQDSAGATPMTGAPAQAAAERPTSGRRARSTSTRGPRTTADKDGCFATMRRKLKLNKIETQSELRKAIQEFFADSDDRPSARAIQAWAKQLWNERR